MCGICGQFNFKHNEPVDREAVRRMTRTLAHRGPDDEGFFFSGPLGLGFRRLSIIDLARGHQPMSDPEGSVWVVFNGEIYNFPELRRELEAAGHAFRTGSDTEVIVHGYKQWGQDVFGRLNGMFGLAIWDQRLRKLIIARDAMGIKLVYYRIESGTLLFGSEIRPLLAGSSGRPPLDAVSLNLFLRYRYTPSPRTLFQGIQKLAPGTMLIVENGTSRLERWYTFRPAPFATSPTPDRAKEELLEIYKRAVKRHLLSDVPVGLLLSGGMDSGLLLGLMRLSGTGWQTYTAGYGTGFQDDELGAAADTARLYSSRHVPVALSKDSFEAALPGIVSCLEEPIASSSIVPMYFVCERARKDVKVVLMGQGPDELFGGYTRHLGVRYGGSWRMLPGWVRGPLGKAIGLLPGNETLKRGVSALAVRDRMARYQQVFSLMPADKVDGLFREDVLPPGAGDSILECWKDLRPGIEESDELGGFQFLEVRSSLPDELLMYADKLSMAHGLEVRVPYLDREVVEYVQRLRADLKVRHGSRKWLHRQVCRNYLPGEIVRRKKRGFAVNVVDRWFRDSLSKRMAGLLSDPRSLMYRYLRPDVTAGLLREHRAGRNDNHKVLFSLVVFEEWLRAQEQR